MARQLRLLAERDKARVAELKARKALAARAAKPAKGDGAPTAGDGSTPAV